MSHITDVKCSILDLTALALAASALGLEMEKSPTYKWYGRSVGDAPLPVGFTEADLGKCEYVIRLPKGHPKTGRAYEVGVVRRKDGQPGYTLMFDAWMGGMGLMEAIGVKVAGQYNGCNNADQLLQRYKTEVTRQQLTKQGYRVNESKTASGEIKLLAMKR